MASCKVLLLDQESWKHAASLYKPQGVQKVTIPEEKKIGTSSYMLGQEVCIPQLLLFFFFFPLPVVGA